MAAVDREKLVVSLESLVDGSSLADVLLALAEVARVKGAHIRDTWQDAGLARVWVSAGRRIERCAGSITV